MVKDAPSFGKIAAMVLFALSCFGLLLFLWLAFGGPVPLKPKGYRFHTSFAEAGQLAPGGRRADLRRAGRQGQDDQPDKLTGRADVVIQLQSRYAPLPSDAKAILRQKTLLGETYVELTPGHASARDDPRGRRAAGLAGLGHGRARRDPPLLRPQDAARRSRTGCRRRRRRSPDRGQDLNDALGNLAPFADDTATLVRHPQPPGGRGLAPGRQHRHRLPGAERARRPAALADPELQHGVRDHGRARRAAQGGLPRAADVRGRVAHDVRPADRVRARDQPAGHAAAARRRASSRRRSRTWRDVSPDLRTCSSSCSR